MIPKPMCLMAPAAFASIECILEEGWRHSLLLATLQQGLSWSLTLFPI